MRFVWTAIALLLLTAGVLAGCGRDQVTGKIGETLTAGDYQLTVTNMENPAERPDRFTNPKVGNRFVKFDIVMTNVGQQHLPVAANHFTLKDSGGIDNTARSDISSDRVLRSTSLAPGQRLETSLYFEMASNVTPTFLVFTPQVVGWRTRIEIDLRGAPSGSPVPSPAPQR